MANCYTNAQDSLEMWFVSAVVLSFVLFYCSAPASVEESEDRGAREENLGPKVNRV